LRLGPMLAWLVLGRVTEYGKAPSSAVIHTSLCT
jgi:hypothetical protein